MLDLAERVQRVRLLLETLNDPYPTPRGLLVPDSGPAPSAYVPCETCRSSGEVRVRGGWNLCLICDGIGWKRREGEPAWDAYLGLSIAEAMELPVEIAARAPAPAGDESFVWERLRRRYDRHGSYQELRRQLDRLSLTRPRRYWLVRAVLVEHETRRLEPGARLELDLGVLEITMRMRTVKVPGWLIERTEAENRRESVGELAASGLGAGEIAKRLGMSKRVVLRKLKRQAIESRHAGVPVTAT